MFVKTGINLVYNSTKICKKHTNFTFKEQVLFLGLSCLALVIKLHATDIKVNNNNNKQIYIRMLLQF